MASGKAEKLSGTFRIPGISNPLEVLWDRWGIAHIFAASVEDAYAGLGFVSAYDRLWQIEIGRLYSTGRAASVLGERLLRNDAIIRTFVNPTGLEVPKSDGDGIVDSYIHGVNGYIDQLDEVPAEFERAGIEPSHITAAEVAAKHRFSSWFQFNTWVNKIITAQLMAEHGHETWSPHLTRFSDGDKALFDQMQGNYQNLDPAAVRLVVTTAGGRAAGPQSGSNNWAMSGNHTRSGKPIVASDPHLQFGIPGTFYLAHLSAPGFDLVGASFPGGPFFPIGHTRNVAWGITTGFIDNSDIYIEELSDDATQYRTSAGWADLAVREEEIDIKGGEKRTLRIEEGAHGPLLEPLTELLDISPKPSHSQRTALKWVLGAHPTSAGALAKLPLSKNVNEFHENFYENGITPTVYNLICADTDNNIRRWIAGNFPKRKGVTGMLPFPAWDKVYDFEVALGDELIAAENPDAGFLATANNDTMKEQWDFPVQNYAVSSARVDRIREQLKDRDSVTISDTKSLQLDLLDTTARLAVPAILELVGGSKDAAVQKAAQVLSDWDFVASPMSAGACVYYSLQATRWHFDFVEDALAAEGHDVSLLRWLPAVGGIGYFSANNFLADTHQRWTAHRGLLSAKIENALKTSVAKLEELMGDDPSLWHWGEIHQVSFGHTLQREEAFAHLKLGPDPVGGAGTTVAMANYLGREAPFRSHHGPVFRMVVDLGDPASPSFVMAAGNSGRPDSPHTMDQQPLWLSGDYITIHLDRDEVLKRTKTSWHIAK